MCNELYGKDKVTNQATTENEGFHYDPQNKKDFEMNISRKKYIERGKKCFPSEKTTVVGKKEEVFHFATTCIEKVGKIFYNTNKRMGRTQNQLVVELGCRYNSIERHHR